jgi:hypothetical protein
VHIWGPEMHAGQEMGGRERRMLLEKRTEAEEAACLRNERWKETGLRIRICIIFGSWVRIRIKVKIQELLRLKMEWKAVKMEAWRLKMEAWRV